MTEHVIEVKKAVLLGSEIRPRMSYIFVDGFYQWLKFFSEDKQKLVGAMEHMFNLDVFYVALIDGDIAGITACTDENVHCVHLEKDEFKKHLGLLRGNMAYSILRKEFELKQYPVKMAPDTGTIEFVATAAEYRGKGVASTIIQHIIGSADYREYILEVADTNTNAVKLYEKLGFCEFHRVPQKNSKRSGVNNVVYMKWKRGH